MDVYLSSLNSILYLPTYHLKMYHVYDEGGTFYTLRIAISFNYYFHCTGNIGSCGHDTGDRSLVQSRNSAALIFYESFALTR